MIGASPAPDPGQVKSDQGARRYSLKRKGKRYANAQTKSTRRADRTPPGSPRPCRLSYTLDDPPGSPGVYVTWELHRTSDGTIIRLNVDEPRPFADSTEDLESAWLPVLSGLVKHLERGPSSPSDRTR